MDFFATRSDSYSTFFLLFFVHLLHLNSGRAAGATDCGAGDSHCGKLSNFKRWCIAVVGGKVVSLVLL